MFLNMIFFKRQIVYNTAWRWPAHLPHHPVSGKGGRGGTPHKTHMHGTCSTLCDVEGYVAVDLLALSYHAHFALLAINTNCKWYDGAKEYV